MTHEGARQYSPENSKVDPLTTDLSERFKHFVVASTFCVGPDFVFESMLTDVSIQLLKYLRVSSEFFTEETIDLSNLEEKGAFF
ncbi:MAG: hypothetical protein RLZZ488_1217 [Pseudomonadota bacterium]|jgi:hypothetical protein